jgi:uncharacterized OB-fold protein
MTNQLARRPEPVTLDTLWWFEACTQRKLLIQRCGSCGRLRHPARPMCSRCRSTRWDAIEASGRGTVYSAVEVHRPTVPGLDYPLAVGLIDLDEGVRLVARLLDVGPDDDVIGCPVMLEWPDVEPSRMLPTFRPRVPAC